jgi:hypothetical protein
VAAHPQRKVFLRAGVADEHVVPAANAALHHRCPSFPYFSYMMHCKAPCATSNRRCFQSQPRQSSSHRCSLAAHGIPGNLELS